MITVLQQEPIWRWLNRQLFLNRFTFCQPKCRCLGTFPQKLYMLVVMFPVAVSCMKALIVDHVHESTLNSNGCCGLQTFKRLADNEELLKGWQDVFVDLLQSELQHLFLSLIDHFLQLSGTQPIGESQGAEKLVLNLVFWSCTNI